MGQILQEQIWGMAIERIQWFRVCTSLAEDPPFPPRTRMCSYQPAKTPDPGELMPLLAAEAIDSHTYKCMCVCVHAYDTHM